ncbi:MAG TPA: GIY-YIG nuclease family protein [Kiritimatiellia bacterium]|nr:GIY-YIG nuclease family protein [Kiritimatiellia bacterium]
MKRNAQLVCQHLENISRGALEEYQDIIRQYVRGRQGIYALFRRGKLYYVGLATNLRTRLTQHLRDRHANSWDRFSIYITIGDHHLRELEALMLRTVKPTGNKQKGKFAKSEDLRRRFRRDMKQSLEAEIDGMFSEFRPARNKSKPKKEDGPTPVLARFFTQPTPLHARFKGKLIRAHVRRDGAVRYSGTTYNSPSQAAAAACRRVSCNGWTFWTYQRAPGDWVYLSTLRA